jgi:plastocyanin
MNRPSHGEHPMLAWSASRQTCVAGAILAGAFLTLVGSGVRAEEQPLAVVLKDHRFEPEIVRVRPGQVLRFDNADDVLHSLTLLGRQNVIGEEFVDPGLSYTVRIPEDLPPGTYELACTIHVDMRGQLWVTGE